MIVAQARKNRSVIASQDLIHTFLIHLRTHPLPSPSHYAGKRTTCQVWDRWSPRGLRAHHLAPRSDTITTPITHTQHRFASGIDKRVHFAHRSKRCTTTRCAATICMMRWLPCSIRVCHVPRKRPLSFSRCVILRATVAAPACCPTSPCPLLPQPPYKADLSSAG